MLKKQIIRWIIAVVLVAGASGGGIVADEMGMSVTGQAQASNCSGSGGNC